MANMFFSTIFWGCLYQQAPNWKTLPIHIDWKCWQGIYSLSGLIPTVVLNTGGLCWHKDLIDWTIMLARLVISAHFALFLNIHWFHTRSNKWLIKDLSRDWQPLLPGWEQKTVSAREVLLSDFAPLVDSCPVSCPFSAFCAFCLMCGLYSWKQYLKDSDWKFLQRRALRPREVNESPHVTQLPGGRSGTPDSIMTNTQRLLHSLKQSTQSRRSIPVSRTYLDCHWSYHASEQIWLAILSEGNLKLINVLTFLRSKTNFI